MPPKGRITCIDLGDDAARSLWRDNILASTEAEALFSYSQLSMKKRPIWAECMHHRALLADAFRCSGGRIINQVKLQAQLMLFMFSCKKQCSVQQAEDAVYRLRAMMSQLRKVASDDRAPPPGFESLQVVLDLIHVGDGSQEDFGLDGDGSPVVAPLADRVDEATESDLEIVEVPPSLRSSCASCRDL